MQIRYDKARFTDDFPVSISADMLYEKDDMQCMHFHDCFEVSLITDGKAYYEFADKKLLLGKGDCIVINNVEIHRALSAGGKWSQLCLVFHPSLISAGSGFDYAYISDFFEKGKDFENLVSASSDISLEIRKLMRDIYEEYTEKNSGYMLMIKAKLLCLLTLLTRRNSNKKICQRKLNMRRLSPALDYIEENYMSSVSLAKAAKKCFITPQYFSIMFSQTLGLSFIQYVTQLRIDKSKELLANTDNSVLDIALNCGYNNLSNFISLFKRQCACTPSNYRKRLRNGNP